MLGSAEWLCFVLHLKQAFSVHSVFVEKKLELTQLMRHRNSIVLMQQALWNEQHLQKPDLLVLQSQSEAADLLQGSWLLQTRPVFDESLVAACVK